MKSGSIRQSTDFDQQKKEREELFLERQENYEVQRRNVEDELEVEKNYGRNAAAILENSREIFFAAMSSETPVILLLILLSW